METKMRRQDRRLTEQEANIILEKGEYGVLSMCDDLNKAYGIPINYARIENRIYFHGAQDGLKLRCFSKHPQVSFCVVGKTALLPSEFGTLYESVIVSGKMTVVNEPDEKRFGLQQLIGKYSTEFKQEGEAYIDRLFERVMVFKLTIEAINRKSRKQ